MTQFQSANEADPIRAPASDPAFQAEVERIIRNTDRWLDALVAYLVPPMPPPPTCCACGTPLMYPDSAREPLSCYACRDWCEPWWLRALRWIVR